MKPRQEPAPATDDVATDLGAPSIGLDGPPPSVDELVAREDAAGLMALGAAYQTGAPHVPVDAFKALECFEAASRLGDADAEYLVGTAFMDGLGVAADVAEGAKRLRSAAQRGSLRAKVYVANLYEMGVVYQSDREKADVWYRNVARAAGIGGEPGDEAHDLAMAELGCVRHCLALVADDALAAKDRAFYLKKAKTMGYEHRLAMSKRESAPPVVETAPAAPPKLPPAVAEPAPQAPEAPAERAEARNEAPAEDEEDDAAPLLGAQWTWGSGLLAFAASAFFASAATGAGALAMEGSRALAEAGRPLPHLGSAHEVVLWATVLALGVLPATATYRPKIVALAAALGAAGAAGGHYLWDVSRIAWDRLAQSVGAGVGVFLLVVLSLGVLGGTRARIRARREHPPRRRA